MARGMLESSYQLVSEQFNPEMEDNTVCALMEEAISNLQMSQVKLKETYECHGKLLIKILQHLENLRSVESSIEKTSQADHAIIEPRVWRCSINTNGNVRAQNHESTAASATPELPLPTPIGGAHIQFPFPDDVVKVSIDSFPIKLSKGFTVLQACKVVGVDIPRSCCHSLLFVGENCQVCLVEVEKSPKPVISCAMPALLEMTIKTYTLVAKKAREDMMAFQLVNHLLGCPIFDPGGECDHQDQLMALGS